MLKTNSKIVKNRIRKYITESVADFLEEREVETNKPITEFFVIINEEKFHQKYRCEFDMVQDWMQGLGCNIGVDIYAHFGTAKNILADWLEETEEEKEKYSETEAENLMMRLIYREMDYMRKQEQKTA